MNTRANLIASIAALLLAQAALAEDAKNIIFFGNSFTQSGNGIQHIVRDVAIAVGQPAPFVVAVASGGMTLEQHAIIAPTTVSTSIPAGSHWDYAVMQEFSTRPTSVAPVGGNVPAFLSATNSLFQTVRNHSPNAKGVLFETWARGPSHEYYPTYWPVPEAMQAELRANYHTAADNLNATFGPDAALFAPVGDAFEDGGFDPSLYSSDIYHASNKGALLISLVIYGRVYEDRITTDLDLAAIGAGLGLSSSDIADVAHLADGVLVPTPPTITILAMTGLVCGRRRR